ncbi:MAG: formylglycine-generating enzyme family protein [Pseudomonadota bacterium]|nr:formylglycine-generating enzyme family protein [Pseudomonadota bacterium]
MSEKSACCAPTDPDRVPEADRGWMEAALAIAPGPQSVRDALRARLIPLDGGFFDMGARKSTFPADLDSPRRKVKVSPFLISPVTVSNADFAAFVEATGYKTVAEDEGWSFVFHLLLADATRWPQHPPNIPWWRRVDGAYWAAPEGPGSDWRDRADHPAVHIAWYDALAYTRWAGLRLPREAEWEFAARGGLERQKFPWGNVMAPDGVERMNTWQGEFPVRNTAEDGWVGTAPVDAFAPNAFGLFNTTGNVWEWVADFAGPRAPETRRPLVDPRGPETGSGRVQRGGSYLCHVSYCDRYHVHSRTRNDADSSAGNAGFRVAASV